MEKLNNETQVDTANHWITYQSHQGTNEDKHIVLVSGDEEYRSEEALPMLAKILAIHHGFKCTVLFAIDTETGIINPENQTSIPGLHHLETADMMILFTRFRELPDQQMKYIIDYTNQGKPIMGLRTATHAFNYTRNLQSPYAKYDFKNEDFPGGYGRQVLGETWINHHGHHGKESARGIINEEMATHPILQSVQDIWGPSDVYTVNNLTDDAQVLVWGQVLIGMESSDDPNLDKPKMPLAWIKTYTGDAGKTSRVFCTTMGASVDLENEGLRRLLVNSCYWCMDMEDQIPAESQVDYVGEYTPTFFGFGTYQKGMRPSDFSL
ncbi:hypothetical protein CMK22_12465 [Candidatus Poribacteria bacterium]|nr:hypothetical protein [Candidatus Poribacteria bacterium]